MDIVIYFFDNSRISRINFTSKNFIEILLKLKFIFPKLVDPFKTIKQVILNTTS